MRHYKVQHPIFLIKVVVLNSVTGSNGTFKEDAIVPKWEQTNNVYLISIKYSFFLILIS